MNLWAHNLLNQELPTTWCSVLHTTKQHPHTLTHTLTHHYSLYLSPLTILLPSKHHTHNYKQHQQLHYIITAPVDSTIFASVLARTLHSLLAPTPPTPPTLCTTLHTPHSTVSYFFRLIVTCPIAPVDSAKVGYSTLQSKAQTAGPSTPQTLRGGLEECLNCCLLKTCVLGVATTTNDRPNTIWGVQTLGGSELTGNAPFKGNQPAQITGTEAEPQQIVAQRLLSCLQYPVP